MAEESNSILGIVLQHDRTIQALIQRIEGLTTAHNDLVRSMQDAKKESEEKEN